MDVLEIDAAKKIDKIDGDSSRNIELIEQSVFRLQKFVREDSDTK
jgi:hypothetical protein